MEWSGPEGKAERPPAGEAAPTIPPPLELTIQTLAFGGSGIGRTPEGLVVLVERSAPGDRLRVEIVHRHRRFARARVREVLSPSPARRSPDCPHFDSCGGCAYQHIDYGAELEAKRGQVHDLLERVAGIAAPPVTAVWPSPICLGYRNRMTFSLPPAEGTGAGLHRREDPARVMEVPECRLPSAGIMQAYGKILPELRQLSAPFRPRRIELRESDPAGPPLLLLHGPGSPGADLRRLAVRWVREGHVRGAAWVPDRHGRPGPAVVLHGPIDTTAPLGKWELRLSPGGFFQANAPLAAKVFEEIGRRCRPGGEILELYAGVGALTLYLAGRGRRVTAVEGNPASVAAARGNLLRHGEGEVSFLARPVEKAVEGFSREGRRFPTLVLDPPRTGLPRGVAEQLIPMIGERILYLSCDPATLARDLALLGRGGRWRLREAVPVDFFPRTAGVECLADLEAASVR